MRLRLPLPLLFFVVFLIRAAVRTVSQWHDQWSCSRSLRASNYRRRYSDRERCDRR